MTSAAQIISLGSPRFVDAPLQQLARESGDAAVWARLCESGDAKALAGVAGDFAIGFRDAQGRCLVAVDRFATRSLCYRIRPDRIDFAARADELADEHDEVDPQAIFDYLYFHCIPSPRTIYKNVFRLPPAHCLMGRPGDYRLVRYWTPAFEEPRQGDFAALAQEFRSTLRDAVARQLNSGRPACYLSGGTDSSTVAGMLREISAEAPQAYSIGFEAAGYDEMEFARLAARRFGVAHHEYYVTQQDILDGMAQVASHYDQPFGNSSALPAYYCARRAREDGVERLLAGDGGDELFGGNARYAKQRVFGWYRHVPGPLRGGLLEPVLGRPWSQRIGLLRKGGSYVEQARVPMPARLEMYNLLLRLGPEAVLTPELLHSVDPAAPLSHQQEVWDQVQGVSELNTTLAFDWRYTLAESDLPKVVGSAGMAGVDVGFPFLDTALLDFSLRLPVEYKLKGLQLRWFFKEALRGFLPDEIITKKKHGFGLPFGLWVGQHAGLGRQSRGALHGLVERGVVRGDFVRRLFDELLPQHPGYYGEMVWIMAMLELWLQAHRPNYRLGR